MNKINWRVRFKNVNFWIAIIPAFLLLVQYVAALFGYQLNLDGLSAQLLDVVKTAFTCLAIMGIVTDPTTKGIGDSQRALGYSDLN